MNSCTFAKFNLNGIRDMRNGKIYKILDETASRLKAYDDKGVYRTFAKSYFSIPSTLYINE